MDIQEAIKHYKEKADGTECGREHAQLAAWLEELKDSRDELDKLRGILNQWIQPCFCEGHNFKCLMCETREALNNV